MTIATASQFEIHDIDLNDLGAVRFTNAESLLFFSVAHLPHYFNLDPAEFHHELVDLLGDPAEEMIAIIGFRGSAKTTFGSLSLPLWAALTGKFKFILVVNDTADQMELNIENIKYELENNAWIRRVYPHIRAHDTGWSKNKLLLSNGVRILGRSRGQKIRGIRHRQYRPDLVIVDDPEDLAWVQKKENRDKTERWFNSEVIPAVQEDKSKLVVIGNFLHTDALMARIKKNGLFRVIEFPLVKDDGTCTWTSKYPTQESLEKQRKKVGETSWMREYLLKVVPEEGQIVKDTDIRKYDNELLTTNVSSLRLVAKRGGAGEDLAISKKTTADFTSIVSGIMVEENGLDILYVMPNPVNDRLSLAETVETSRHVLRTLPAGSKLFVENVAYQAAAIEEMAKKNMPVVGLRPITDKRARLETAAIYIKNGQVRFPLEGCEDLLFQLLGFGVESHDDLVDALVYLILGMFDDKGGAVASTGSPTRI